MPKNHVIVISDTTYLLLRPQAVLAEYGKNSKQEGANFPPHDTFNLQRTIITKKPIQSFVCLLLNRHATACLGRSPKAEDAEFYFDQCESSATGFEFLPSDQPHAVQKWRDASFPRKTAQLDGYVPSPLNWLRPKEMPDKEHEASA
ncbi:uncharacterized protein ATNIH1004_006561 [Aspergillus tanneri]|uniref:Uncharacterized protein n=1 Tax=Aspergillus tanneri TaxID=1220188 RepID=A0A5M9MTE9_9EURO|nr:uncharacterized protein ATNIH1004_006561 [Aspergillus tanneri]KAA8647859.1 hypothetical protein ATNIH1004_006561 [Aspergillus tanneri]